MATVHIIGAGISGLAAATALAEAHVPVKLYEAATGAGGRCRSSHDATLGSYDHGLHGFNGAARELQKFIARIDARDQFIRLAMPVAAHDAKSGEDWTVSPLRLLPAAPLADYLHLLRALLWPHGSLEDALPEHSPLQDSLLQPLARLALTQSAHKATARQLQRLLLRQLRRGARHYYLAKHSLQQSLITPALARLEYLGGSVYFGQALKSVETAGRELRGLTFARKKLPLDPEDVLIVATPAPVTKNFFPHLAVPTQQHSAITLHFHCAHREMPGSIRLLANAEADLLRYDDGAIRAAIRVADAAWHSDEDLLAARLWRMIAKLHPYLQAQPLPAFAIWREKRAGHVPQDVPLPAADLPERCLLAGDWLDAARPATLEAAALHGHRAAERALALVGRNAAPSQRNFYLN